MIALLRAALRAGQLFTNMAVAQTEEMLAQQENRWWSIKIQSFKSKEHFLRYAGRTLHTLSNPTIRSKPSAIAERPNEDEEFHGRDFVAAFMQPTPLFSSQNTGSPSAETAFCRLNQPDDGASWLLSKTTVAKHTL